jgi:hypothetical protein
MGQPPIALANDMKRNLATLLLATFFVAAVMSACTTAAVGEVREVSTALDTGEAIAFLFSPRFSLDAQRVEEREIIGCISETVRKTHPALRIVPPGDFRRKVFPNIAPEAAPNTPEYLELLLSHPTFKERVAALGIHYLISVIGGTEQTGGVGAVPLGGGAGGVVVIAGSWDRKSSLTATVLDLQRERTAGKLEASASGHPWLLIIFPTPIMGGAAAFTESRACGDLGEAVATFMAGGHAPEAEEMKR